MQGGWQAPVTGTDFGVRRRLLNRPSNRAGLFWVAAQSSARFTRCHFIPCHQLTLALTRVPPSTDKPAGGLRPARGLSGTVAPNCTPEGVAQAGVRVAPQAAAVADGESRVAVGAGRGRRGGWRKQSPSCQ